MTALGVEPTACGNAAAPVRRFGRYEVGRPLGRGAMGVVYLARDPALERTVALKTVWWAEQGGADDELQAELRARFLHEARAAAQFVHSSIVTVFDVGEEGDATFIAMEYVAGRTLADLLAEEGPLPPVRAATLAASVAGALAYAHAKGVVHRDIKPANLLIDVDGQVKVADFGIAKVAGSSLTQEATILGTPAYMAPEQISGRPVDARSDLFSLGVVLFEMVTGLKPFDGSDLTSLLYQVVHAPHPSLASLRPGLPVGLEAVCARALAKAPDARYQTGAEMAADLRAVAAGGAPAGSTEQTLVVGIATSDVAMGSTVSSSEAEARAAAIAAQAALTATRLGHHSARLLERLLTQLGVAIGVVAGVLAMLATRTRAALLAMPPGQRAVVVGAVAGALAVAVAVSMLVDPVRPARALLAEGKRSEAVALLLEIAAKDPDQVDARILLLEHADSCSVRKRVARRLGELGDPDALPALEAARRRGLVDNLCMGGTLGQAIAQIRGETRRASAPNEVERAPAQKGNASGLGRSLRRLGDRIGEVFK